MISISRKQPMSILLNYRISAACNWVWNPSSSPHVSGPIELSAETVCVANLHREHALNPAEGGRRFMLLSKDFISALPAVKFPALPACDASYFSSRTTFNPSFADITDEASQR